MMPLRKFLIVTISILLFLGLSCSSTPKRRSLGETIDDAVISNKLKARYLSDRIVKGLRINVTTWKGIVSLKGKLNEQIQVNRAIEIAERQPGVREVKSYLAVENKDFNGVVLTEENNQGSETNLKSALRKNEESEGYREEDSIEEIDLDAPSSVTADD